MPKQERALRTRGELVRAAAEAFDRVGFVSSSLTAISRDAGVSTGALHFHFESKIALAAAVGAEAKARVRSIIDAAYGRTDVSALHALVDVTQVLARALREDVILRAGFQLGSDLARSADCFLRQEWQQCVDTLFRQARREGSLAASVDTATATAVVVAVTVGFDVLQWNDRA